MGFLYTVLIVGGIGLLLGIILSLASKFFAVKTDERVESLKECLPGANCGACGFSGCEGYAVALANGEAAPNLCTVGGDEAVEKISEILGVKAAPAVKKTAVIHCHHCSDKVIREFAYNGAASCAAASLLYGGPLGCKQGCIGLGDCIKACEYGALSMIDGNVTVDMSKCVACGECQKACPKGIISIEYAALPCFVGCSNTEKGAVARKKCSAACIGCKKCEKVCPSGAIEIKENLAVIDYEKCTGCGECERNCPTHAILLK